MTTRNPKRMRDRERVLDRKAHRRVKYRPSDLAVFGLEAE